MGLYVSLGIVKVRGTNEGPRMSHLVRDGLLGSSYVKYHHTPTQSTVEL